MELQWDHKACGHLQRKIRQIQNLEQTQELRLTDGMPDIGRVLCAWGQPMLRGKEWKKDGMSVSGGVTVWVLYLPEDGSEPRSVETWLPMQGKWSFPDSEREGVIRVDCLLRSVDARILSSRKMMIRAAVGMLGEALENTVTAIYTPGQTPDAVEILRRTYPVQLPKEAGEKQFTLEEEIPVSGIAPRKILSCDMQPMVTEASVLGGKAVFRGNCRIHTVYMGEDDRIHAFCAELPFAQFADLDRDYDKEASASVMMAVSGLESELREGRLCIQCSLIAQYMVFDRCLLEIAEDAYSINREMKPQMEQLMLPVVLDRRQEAVSVTAEAETGVSDLVDITFRPDHPTHYREGTKLNWELPGAFQLLYYDEEGNLQSRTEPWSTSVEVRAGEDCSMDAQLTMPQQPGFVNMGDRVSLTGQMTMELLTSATQKIPMLSGMTVGEPVEPNPQRPSLILRRAEDASVWELAKRYGSTVEAIRSANGLEEEPVGNPLLLIPIV